MKILIYLIFVSLIFGPFASIPLGISAINIYLTDILALLISHLWLFRFRELVKLFKKCTVTPYFFLFVASAGVSLVFSPISLTIAERVTSALYLLRFFAYAGIGVTVYHLVQIKELKRETVVKCLVMAGLISAVFGWLQYLLYEDLRNLYYLGWDPHLKRIFSFYFDPNYFGILLVLTMIVMLFHQMRGRISKLFRVPMLLMIFMTLAFTYSRSSFVSLVGSSVALSLLKRRYLISLLVIIVLMGTVFILPRPYGEGVKLERMFSIHERIESYKLALGMFADHPILGVGFNAVRYAKRTYGISWEYLSASHSGAGFDSSLLFVAATTGIIGLSCFLLFLFHLYENGGLVLKVSLVAVLIHSLFLNSLFYPWVMVWIWILAGLGRVADS